MSIKKFLVIVLFFFASALPFHSYAQSMKFSFSVSLVDSLTGEPVSFATIMLSKDGTAKGALFSTTNDKGKGTINGIQSGKYIFIADMMGYVQIKKDVVLSDKDLDLGSLKMLPDVTMLEQATISAVGNPIIVKKDTLEYNAAAYKITENDVLEDLLKKLPGVEVGSDGSITANGKTISKVMIDGKEFFLDDPQLASKNIPAKVVEKVKVVEKKSDQAVFTGIDDGEEETVLDLSVKPGMMDSWFGTVTAGGGHDISSATHDLRWQGSGMVGKFSDNYQVSIIANGNNTNNRGFNDMNSSMFGGMRDFGGRRGMGGMGNGITTSWMGGINGGFYIGGNKDRQLFGNYLYNGSDNRVDEQSTRTTFISEGESLLTNNNSSSFTYNDGHRAGVNFDYKFTDKTSIIFRPSFTYSNNYFNEESEYSTVNSLTGKVNDGSSLTSGWGDSWTTDGMFLLRQKLGDTPGRTISVHARYSLSQTGMIGNNTSTTRKYTEDVAFEDLVDQKFDRKEDSYSVSGNVTYTEPLGKNFYLMGSYRINWSTKSSEKYTYSNYTGNLDSLYSSVISNNFLNHRMQVSFSKQEAKYNIQIGAEAQPSTTSTHSSLGFKRDTTYTIWNFAPSARIDLRFSDNKFLRINYRGRTSEPTINQLMPIPDNSDPLRVALGNTSLKPAFRNTLMAHYQYTDMKHFSSYSVFANFAYIKDNIVNASWYDKDGIQYTAPINSSRPSYNGQLFAMINSPIAKSDFSISSFTNASLSSGLTYTGTDNTASTLEEALPSMIGGRTTSLSLSERLTFVYRNQYIEARLGGQVTYKNAWYEIASQSKPYTFDNGVTAEFSATAPWGTEFKTDAVYNFYYGYEAGYGDPKLIWNAELSQNFLKNKLNLKLKVYDILNQSKNNYRNTADNYVEDVINNTLGQYFIISLTYKFGTFDKMKGAMRGPGPGGPGGPGGRPR